MTGIVGKTAGRLEAGDIVLIDNDRWRVVCTPSIAAGWAYLIVEHADPAPGQRPARWSRQYRRGHSFTVVAR